MNVFILATVRNPALVAFTECVFKSLRVGFPTAKVKVYLNGHVPQSVIDLATGCGCAIEQTDTIHHAWLKILVLTEQEPFFISDCDVIYYQDFERFVFTSALAGWRIPEWKDEFTNTITRARLHTSLLYIDPIQVRQKIAEYDAQFPTTEFNPRIELFYPIVLPLKQRAYFHDTCGLLYHAIGGQSFTDEQLSTYFHFNFGSISDIVLPHLSDGKEMAERRKVILEHLELGRGLWRSQIEYYAARKPVIDGKDVIDPIDPKDAQDAVKWNVELCQGNQDAMAFNDLWYNYCHGIDDLLDSMEDDRPVMSKDQMLSLFLKAAVIYNSRFFVQHRELLFPIVLDTTNTYSLSVDWERSPKAHLRAMADVWRTAGNRMFSMVALICGGDAHMKRMSALINERDFLNQHDANGNPI